MSLSIKFTEEGRNKLHELHIETQNKIKTSLKELVLNLNLGKKLTGNLVGFYSLIVGKYRVIYTIDKLTILVHYTGHRKEVYSKFEESL